MAKQNVIYLHHEIILWNKTEQITNTYNNFDGSQGSYDEWKKTISKDHMQYDFI